MKFKSEDEAYDVYLEHLQSEMPFDISDWNQDFSDGFFDWMDSYNVEITDE
jgi:hypothetical protein